jgi:hypothetical protein
MLRLINPKPPYILGNALGGVVRENSPCKGKNLMNMIVLLPMQGALLICHLDSSMAALPLRILPLLSLAYFLLF